MLLAYVIRYLGVDVLYYLKYTPVWLSFYYFGMFIKKYKTNIKTNVLWILLPVSLATELASTALLFNVDGYNAYSQLRFAGAFYSLILICLAYEYSKKIDRNDYCKLLVKLGDDSYAIYYMHCIFLMVFSKVIVFKDNTFLLLYQFGELIFAVLMSELIIFIIKKLVRKNNIRMIFGV